MHWTREIEYVHVLVHVYQANSLGYVGHSVQFNSLLLSLFIITAPGPVVPAVLDLTGSSSTLSQGTGIGASTGGTEADPLGPTAPEGSELGDTFRQVSVSGYYPIQSIDILHSD